jgi:ribonucleoside-diphosphate reductase alpha chain
MTIRNDNGPKLGISEEIHAMKYRSKGETFREAMTRVAQSLQDDDEHFQNFRDAL